LTVPQVSGEKSLPLSSGASNDAGDEHTDEGSGGGPMRRRGIPGVPGETSPVAIGFEFFATLDDAAPLLDAFYAAGGNLFDTAYVYGKGVTETIFGDWLSSRGVRDECLIIGKGAHTPHCTPDAIVRQLGESLDRMQVDHVDIYLMHRDNPDVPVGEFVDAIDAEVNSGRIRGPFGGSNWTMRRIDAAVAYAEANGKKKPEVLSNNFALAEMLDPIWPGCVTSSGAAWREWLKARQMTNFAWSSQGRGFFTGRAGRDKGDDEELVRVWYSEENFARRDRAIELAGKIGRSPIHIALAYVLAQPFPVIPLIGPRTRDELADSLSALDIALTPQQVAWLQHG
jgi:aryl-alcohol dehydrogenase-like predicted oxidoreductase